MQECSRCSDKISALIKGNNIHEAKEAILEELKKHPYQLNLLTIASDVYRALSDRSTSLKHAELLVKHHPDTWVGYGRSAEDLSALHRLEEAKEIIVSGLEKFPNQFNLLTIAIETFRAAIDRKSSLKYAELLIIHHPETWIGYGRAAQDLTALKRLEEAQQKIDQGLEKFPNHLNLLTIGSDVCRTSKDLEGSLNYAELLIIHHPSHWNGYGRAAEDLNAIKRFNKVQAREKIQEGLQKHKNQLNLLTIASDIYRASGNREKSQQYARHLIKHHPNTWQGYDRLAQDLVALNKIAEAHETIQLGLAKNPNNFQLLKIGSELHYKAGCREKSLEYSECLIQYFPSSHIGYKNAALNFALSGQINIGRSIAESGISRSNDNTPLIALLSDIALWEKDYREHERLERFLANRIYQEDIYSKLSLSPNSLRTKLDAGCSDNNLKNQPTSESFTPHLYILAGFSGCGKSTFLNSTRLDTNEIFCKSPKKIKILSQETRKLLTDLEGVKGRSFERAMLQGTYFQITDIPILCIQKQLPRKTLLHLDLANLLMSPYLGGFAEIAPLRPVDLQIDSKIKRHLSKIFASSFFNKFESISIATIDIEYSLNVTRFEKRTGRKFYFGPESQRLYKQAMKSWHDYIQSLPTSVDNLVTEANGHYTISQKNKNSGIN